jgi:hypothetical protein
MLASVYLMKNMANGYYKIGQSRSPFVRERTLQAQEPDVRLLASVETRSAFERKLHQRYAHQRVRGEWFALEYGDLSNLASSFGVDIESIDPPVDTIQGDRWIATIHKYGPDRYSTRVRRPRSHQWVLEVPYQLGRCDIDDEVTTQAFGCEVPPDLCGFLERCVVNMCLAEYSVDSLRVELRELLSFDNEDASAFYVLPSDYVLPRFFYAREFAEKFFRRVQRTLDVYAALSAN